MTETTLNLYDSSSETWSTLGAAEHSNFCAVHTYREEIYAAKSTGAVDIYTNGSLSRQLPIPANFNAEHCPEVAVSNEGIWLASHESIYKWEDTTWHRTTLKDRDWLLFRMIKAGVSNGKLIIEKSSLPRIYTDSKELKTCPTYWEIVKASRWPDVSNVSRGASYQIWKSDGKLYETNCDKIIEIASAPPEHLLFSDHQVIKTASGKLAISSKRFFSWDLIGLCMIPAALLVFLRRKNAIAIKAIRKLVHKPNCARNSAYGLHSHKRFKLLQILILSFDVVALAGVVQFALHPNFVAEILAESLYRNELTGKTVILGALAVVVLATMAGWKRTFGNFAQKRKLKKLSKLVGDSSSTKKDINSVIKKSFNKDLPPNFGMLAALTLAENGDVPGASAFLEDYIHDRGYFGSPGLAELALYARAQYLLGNHDKARKIIRHVRNTDISNEWIKLCYNEILVLGSEINIVKPGVGKTLKRLLQVGDYSPTVPPVMFELQQAIVLASKHKNKEASEKANECKQKFNLVSLLHRDVAYAYLSVIYDRIGDISNYDFYSNKEIINEKKSFGGKIITNSTKENFFESD